MNYTRHQGNSITLERPSSQNYPLTSYGFPGKRMLVVINPRVEDAQMLVAGVQSGAEVLILDPSQDGVEQITEALKERSEVSSLHLVCHGSPGCLHLGSTALLSL